MIKPLPSISH